jgi:anti-sigma-K factor RskA
MLEALPELDPSAELWPRVDALIDLREADAPRRARRRTVRWPLARATAIGLGAALAGALAAMAIFVFALGGLEPRPPGASPVLITQMQGPDHHPDLAIRYDPVGSAIRVRTRRFDAVQGVVDLWLLAPNGTPQFLGRVTSDGVERFAISRTTRQLIKDGATVMVTLAPADSVRRSEPAGTVIATARFVMV